MIRVRAAALLLAATVLAPALLRADEGEALECVAPSACEGRAESAPFHESDFGSAASYEPQAGPEAPPEGPEPPKEPPPKRPSLAPRDFWRDVKVEAKRYVADSFAVVTAPVHWKAPEWRRAGAVAVALGGLFLVDEAIDRQAQKQRSGFTNAVSDATTGFGDVYGVNVAVGFLAAGYVFRSWELRETGREALEAGFITHVIGKWVLKPAFGRERPTRSGGETVFRPGSSDPSFPSGHATESFAVASVIATRSKGWVVPTVAYTLATLVALNRVNDRAHFASDVAAGAALGTAVGRFIVRRHKRAQQQTTPSTTEFDLVPIPGGLAGRLAF